MLMPFRTLADPETQGEGSIDPLGMATLADHLADWILPGMRARMWRPRFLTAMAVTAKVCEPFEDQFARDGVTPAWLVLEWYFVEAIAGLRDPGDDSLRRIPGIDKARRSRREQVPLNADRYLKTPKVFGFNGVYKILARHLDIVDDELRLGENGYRLLKTWAAEQEVPEFLDPEREGGDAAKALQRFRDALRDALAAGQTERRGAWPGGEFLGLHLLPGRIGRAEAALLWDLLVDPSGGPRGEVFQQLREPETRRMLEESGDERILIRHLRERVSPGLKARFDAIEAYEGVCRLLQEAWDHLRRLATGARSGVVRPADFTANPRLQTLAAGLPGALTVARERLAESPVTHDFERLAAAFDGVRDGATLFRTLWDRHIEVQRSKPPEGKRRWFEETAEGGLVVRPPFRLDEEIPPREWFVHPYRLTAVGSFLRDLAGGA